MIEPTESESKQELDRFCDAMIHIRGEIEDVVKGTIKAKESPLIRSPHTLRDITEGVWNRPYTIEQAVYPLPWVKQHKFWPSVNRLDNVWGDRNLFCSCDGFEKVAELKKD
jgi:glycine dehydrogenase